MRRFLLLWISYLWFFGLQAAEEPKILPYPQQYKQTKAHFQLRDVSLTSPKEVTGLFADWLQETQTVLRPDGTQQTSGTRQITVTFTDSLPGIPVNPEEAYRLRVTDKQIHIEAVTAQGVYWAVQTLRQLTVKQGKQYVVAGCEITDWPAFRVRGFLHDVGRSYLSIEELKREIALLSRYKINVFHWHLTEDQAWRLESKRFPALNAETNMTRFPGKYYTIAEAKELVGWCRQHNMLLIPEIDMPGHSAAFIRAFGYDMQSPEGMAILRQLMDEVCDTFADIPYIHIGTDEVQFTHPQFVPEMVAHVRSKGKKVISWNPGWSYNAGEIDMLQMWSYRGKPHPGIPVIDSRLHYINHYDSFADIVALFNSNIAGQQQGSPDYAGSIIAVWNDRLVQPERNILLENPFYPAMLTLAERTWRGGQDEYFYTKGCLIDPEGSAGYAQFAAFEDRMLQQKTHVLRDEPFAYVKQTNVRWRISDAFPNEGDLTRSFPPEQHLSKEYQYKDSTYHSRTAIGAGIYLRHVWGATVPSFYADPQPNHTAYAWTWVWSPNVQQVGLLAGTQNYGRSEKDLPPPPGKWDYRESCFWLNDVEIAPPVWTTSHTTPSNETPLGNENFEARPPLSVQLQKGWNKVLIKLPIGSFSSREVRLQKWMFTFVFVTPDGRNAVDGLVYSPDRKR